MGLSDLFKPAWQSKNAEKRMKTVAKFKTDNDDSIAKLQKIAADARFEDVRQTVWKRIAIEVIDWKLCNAAADRITDEVYLKEVALKASNSSARIKAVEKLTDQALLSNIAMNDTDYCVRLTATEKLDASSQQSFLSNIAMNDEEDNTIRLAATEKLKDASLQQSLFISILKNGKTIPNGNQVKTIEKIKDEATAQKLWADAAMQNDRYLCEKAVEKLTDQMQLAYVAAHGQLSLDVRTSLFKKLNDPLALKYYIENTDNKYASACELNKIHNQEVLKSICENRNNSIDIRIKAIGRLSNKEQRNSCVGKFLLEYGIKTLLKEISVGKEILINTDPNIWTEYCQAETIWDIMEELKRESYKCELLLSIIQIIYKYRDDLRTAIMNLDGQMLSAATSAMFVDDDGWYGTDSPAKYLGITKKTVDTIYVKIYEQEN